MNSRHYTPRGGFDLRMGFGDRPALMCIDLIKAFIDSEAMLGSNLDNEIEAGNTLITLALKHNIPVFFSIILFEDTDLEDGSLWAIGHAFRMINDRFSISSIPSIGTIFILWSLGFGWLEIKCKGCFYR